MRSCFKCLGLFVGWCVAMPFLCGCYMGGMVVGRSKSFTSTSEWLGLIPGNFGIYTRKVCYSVLLKSVGRDVSFGFMSLFSKQQAQLGDRVYIGRFCTIGWANIGDNVLLADGVQVLSGGNQHRGRKGEHEPQFDMITIGDGAWIGAGAVVMADVGPGAIVGAGAVVTKPIAATARVGGIPAKPLGITGDARAFT